MVLKIVARLGSECDSSGKSVGKRSRFRAFNEREGFTNTLVASHQTEFREFVVRSQSVCKECRAKLLAGYRRAQLFGQRNCSPEACFSESQISFIHRQRAYRAVTT